MKTVVKNVESLFPLSINSFVNAGFNIITNTTYNDVRKV